MGYIAKKSYDNDIDQDHNKIDQVPIDVFFHYLKY